MPNITPYALAAALTATASAQPLIDAPVAEDDQITGIGTVTSIEDVHINNQGDYILKVVRQTPFTGGFAIINQNGPLITSGQNLGLGDTRTYQSFGTARLNNKGDWTTDAFITGYPDGIDRAALVFNGQILITQGDHANAPQFPPNTTYTAIIEAYPTDNDQIFLRARVDSPAYTNIPYATWPDHDALIRLQLNRNPTTGEVTSFTETVLIQQNQTLPGTLNPNAQTAEIQFLPHTTAVAPDGSAWVARVEALLPLDLPIVADANDWTVVQSGTVILEELDDSPVPGRPHQFLDASGLDINTKGDIAIKANLTGDFIDDEIIAINETTIVVQENESLPDIAPFRLGTIGNANGPLFIDDNANVLWVGSWNNPDTNANDGLFRNRKLIIESGVTPARGLTVTRLDDGRKGFALSDNGRFAIANARLEDPDAGPRDAALRIDFGAQTCPADTNNDQTVGLDDLLTVLANFGNAPAGGPADGDIHPPGAPDGTVGLEDLLLVLANFSNTCP